MLLEFSLEKNTEKKVHILLMPGTPVLGLVSPH